MDIIPFARSIRQHYNRRKRGYNNSSSSPSRRSIKVVRLGAKPKRSWRLRLVPRLRLIRLASPAKLWYGLKRACTNVFGTAAVKRIQSKDAEVKKYSRSEFENRLIFEIYKNTVASYELGYTK